MKGSAAPVDLHWLEDRGREESPGAAWGVPWPRGSVDPGATFSLRSADGTPVPVQSWPLAYWPDGSLKWSGHAVAGTDVRRPRFTIEPGASVAPPVTVTVDEEEDRVSVDTGTIRCDIARSGMAPIRSLVHGVRELAGTLELACLCQDAPEVCGNGTLRQRAYIGEVISTTVEQRGPIRAVVKLEGIHVGSEGRRWLPFVVRLYFYAGSAAIRFVHTFVFDGDEERDFIRGIGVRFRVPLVDALHDRHVRFAGDLPGLWAECVRNFAGLRRDAGRAAIEAQLAGTRCPPVAALPDDIGRRLSLVPAFGDYTLLQATPDSFRVRKRTDARFAWLEAGGGRRSEGLGYVGGVSGGVAFGIRDFWQRHPTGLDIRGAAGERAEVSLWLWAPDAPAMDMRFYHDGMGMDSYARQLEGLEITYEDYEPGFSTAKGVARTSEMLLWALPSTPPREHLVAMAEAVGHPAVAVCKPGYYAGIPVFGGLWSPADRSTPHRARLEDLLDGVVEFYRTQVDEHSWYGFWNHGDIMHTYDADRHAWRYDVGGYAWDNSECAPDLLLWYAFLRTGRAETFRMAEAMTRHTGEVDVYHLGRFRGLGSRHNVRHWGCSAKQARISQALYRRFLYYLAADERTGDLMREVLRSDERLAEVMPLRKYAHRWPREWVAAHPAVVTIGTDWCAVASAWLAEWERTGDAAWRDRIIEGMRSIGTMRLGWFSGAPIGYDPASGRLFARPEAGPVEPQHHMQAMFGSLDFCAELVQLVEVPEFRAALLTFCELCNAPPEEQARVLGEAASPRTYGPMNSRLTAYAARQKGDVRLAWRAWREFLEGDGRLDLAALERPRTRVEGSAVLRSVAETAWKETNIAVLWSLAAIQNLALIGEHLPKDERGG